MSENNKQPERDPQTGKITKGVAQDTNKNGTAGVSSLYKAEYCEQLIAHFSVEKSEKVTVEREERTTKTGAGSVKEKYRIIPNDLPTFEGFARKIGVTYKTLHAWATERTGPEESAPLKHPEFGEAYNTAKEMQKEFLINNGLAGNYPPASFIFVAKNVTDMTDKQVVVNEDADLNEKRDALDDWLNTLRDNAKAAPKDIS